MTPPDLSKIKPGDEVTVRLVVNAVNENGVFAIRPGWHPSESIRLDGMEDAIVSHTPKALQPGDRVRAAAHVSGWRDKPHIGIIRAIEGDDAWLRWTHLESEPYSTDNIWALTDLERLP